MWINNIYNAHLLCLVLPSSIMECTKALLLSIFWSSSAICQNFMRKICLFRHFFLRCGLWVVVGRVVVDWKGSFPS